jgi:sugar/nucleoside kinase (ribokinase family)
MKLLVIGHSVEDHVDQNGSIQIKPGGIYYSASALRSFMDKYDEIYLCTSVSEKNYNLFKPVYEKLNIKYLQFVESIPFVYLKIQDKGEREECYGSLTGSLELNFKEINMFDGIYLNMITGYDITLEQVIKLRENYKGLIYLDVHTFSRGIDENMERHFRIIPDFNLWAESVDIIQVNKHELLTLSSKKNTEEIILDVLNSGCRLLIVTEGESGSKSYLLNNNDINSVSIHALSIGTKNKVGCGDVFGSIFFYSYLKTGDMFKSLETANIAAGYAASYSDLNEFENLKKDVITRLD